jgi:hypothetical protein
VVIKIGRIMIYIGISIVRYGKDGGIIVPSKYRKLIVYLGKSKR